MEKIIDGILDAIEGKADPAAIFRNVFVGAVLLWFCASSFACSSMGSPPPASTKKGLEISMFLIAVILLVGPLLILRNLQNAENQKAKTFLVIMSGISVISSAAILLEIM